MGARSSFHNEPPEADQRKAVEKQVTRSEFARRLSAAIIRNGWTQAEFAQRAQAKAPEGMRIGPDSISHYVNGRYMPSPAHMAVLASTLGVSPQELLPAKGIPEAGEKLPPVSVQDLKDGHAWLKINQAVTWPVAVKVLALIKGDEE